MKGAFITFEGSEGCGKSTQSRLLYRYLKAKGEPVIYLREPGSNPISEGIRRILLNPDHRRMSAISEMLLYMAARAQLVEQVIAPAVKAGRTVICDRFLDSTLAYQGYGLGMDIKLIKDIGRLATGGLKPDLTVLLGIAASQGLKRCGKVKDRIEQRSLDYHLRVQAGYLKLAKEEPGRIKLVKVAKDKKITQQNIRRLTDIFLKQWHSPRSRGSRRR